MANILNLIRNDYRNAYRPNGKKITNDEYWDNFLWKRLDIGGEDNSQFHGYDVEVMEENISNLEEYITNRDYYAILKFAKDSEEYYVRFLVWWDSWCGHNYDNTLNSMEEVKQITKTTTNYAPIN